MNVTALHQPKFQSTTGNVSLQELAAASELGPNFWQHYIIAGAHALGASMALLLEKDATRGVWRAVMKYPQRSSNLTEFAETLLLGAEQSQAIGQPIESVLDTGQRLRMLPLAVGPSSHQTGAVLALWLPYPAQESVLETAFEHIFIALPEQVGRNSSGQTVSGDVRLANDTLMRLTHDVCMQDRFLKAAYHLCNVLVTKLGAERVSLGIMLRGRIRLSAVSQSADFDRRAAIARDIVDAMEEACDQSRAVAFPDSEEGRVVNRAHRIFSESHGNRAVLSLPFEGRKGLFGVVFIEQKEQPVSTDELVRLRHLLAALGPFLDRIYAADRIFFLRWIHAASEGARFLLGPRQIAAKLGVLTLAASLITASLIEIDHKVGAKATLRSDELSVISVPFDGFLASVHTDLGEHVSQGQRLVTLDQRELLQEETIALADVVRYRREVEKARAVRELANMQIASAQQAQAEAKLELVRFKLANSEILAPRNGIVVEGELRNNLGSPVRQGEPLLKVASTHTLFIELEIRQDTVPLLNTGDIGQASLVGHPDKKIEFEIERIDPVAEVRDNANVFLAKANILGNNQSWWRPGMGGNAKINAGKHPIIWVMTRRTINFLREFFWL